MQKVPGPFLTSPNRTKKVHRENSASQYSVT